MRSDPPCVGSSSTSNNVSPCAREEQPDGGEREVREVLVVDGVELVLGDQAQEVRELQRRHTVRFQDRRNAFDEIVQCGHVSQHVIGDDQIGGLARCQLRGPAPSSKNATSVRIPFFSASAATFAAGSMPSTGIPFATKCCSRYPSLLAISTTWLDRPARSAR